MLGVGVSDASCSAHLEVSSETKVVSFSCGAAVAGCGVGREMVSTRAIEGFLSRLVRMQLPWEDLWLVYA